MDNEKPDIVVVIDNGILVDVLVRENTVVCAGCEAAWLQAQPIYLDPQAVDQDEENLWRELHGEVLANDEYTSIM